VGLLVNVARQHFFTRTGFAGDQHRGIAACHSCGQFEKLRTGRLDSDRAFTFAHANIAQCMPRHQIQQSLGLDRLDQIIRRALTHRIDCAFDRAVSRHQQHG